MVLVTAPAIDFVFEDSPITKKGASLESKIETLFYKKASERVKGQIDTLVTKTVDIDQIENFVLSQRGRFVRQAAIDYLNSAYNIGINNEMLEGKVGTLRHILENPITSGVINYGSSAVFATGTLVSLLGIGAAPVVAGVAAAGVLASSIASRYLTSQGIESLSAKNPTLGKIGMYALKSIPYLQGIASVLTGNLLSAGLLGGSIYASYLSNKANNLGNSGFASQQNYSLREVYGALSSILMGASGLSTLAHTNLAPFTVTPAMQETAHYANLTGEVARYGTGASMFFLPGSGKKKLKLATFLAGLVLLTACGSSGSDAPPQPTPIPDKVQYAENSTMACVTSFDNIHSNYPTDQTVAFSHSEFAPGQTVDLEVIPHVSANPGYTLASEPEPVTLGGISPTFCFDARNFASTESYTVDKIEFRITYENGNTEKLSGRIENGQFRFFDPGQIPPALAAYTQLGAIDVKQDRTDNNSYSIVQFVTPAGAKSLATSEHNDFTGKDVVTRYAPWIEDGDTFKEWKSSPDGQTFESELRFFKAPVVDIPPWIERFADVNLGYTHADGQVQIGDDKVFTSTNFSNITNPLLSTAIITNMDAIKDTNIMYFNGTADGYPTFIANGKIDVTLDGYATSAGLDPGDPFTLRLYRVMPEFALPVGGFDRMPWSDKQVLIYDLLMKNPADAANTLVSDMTNARTNTFVLPSAEIISALNTPTPTPLATGTFMPTNTPGATSTPDPNYCGLTNDNATMQYPTVSEFYHSFMRNNVDWTKIKIENPPWGTWEFTPFEQKPSSNSQDYTHYMESQFADFYGNWYYPSKTIKTDPFNCSLIPEEFKEPNWALTPQVTPTPSYDLFTFCSHLGTLPPASFSPGVNFFIKETDQYNNEVNRFYNPGLDVITGLMQDPWATTKYQIFTKDSFDCSNMYPIMQVPANP